ncbi:MAG: hypothetical protein M3O50_00940 [Myxococcota bacterium]|nr:hypothetical protein [Myxococcota bacterium]
MRSNRFSPNAAAPRAYVRLLLAIACAGCDRGRTDAKSDPPPPPPVASARGDMCAAGGGQDTDAISAPFVPRTVGGYCLDPQGEPKTYGDKGKFSMDEVCTTAFDGECDVYKRFGLDRLVVLRYIDGSGAPNSVEVNLSRFKTADGAYAMYSGRVVADGDPARATVKPLDAGAAGATSSSNAYVWRGQYLAELTFVTEDTKMTPATMALANEKSTGAMAREIGGRLPGSADLLPAVAALPAVSRIPLGIAYFPKDALGLSSVGPVAVGYYKEGDKRWRDVAMVRGDAEAAKETFRAFKLKPGAVPLKGLGDEAVQFVVQEARDRAKAEYVVARKANVVAGIGDEELVLDPSTPADKQAPLKLTKDEKQQKLGAWLAASSARR